MQLLRIFFHEDLVARLQFSFGKDLVLKEKGFVLIGDEIGHRVGGGL